MTRVLVTGANGRMGREVCRGVLSDPELELAGAVDMANIGADIGELLGDKPAGLTISGSLQDMVLSGRPEVLVDFTNCSAALNSARIAANGGLNVVIGTTGMNVQQVNELQALAEECGTGILLAPNFAIGAILMMHFSSLAARYFPSVEIIELHHDQKIDAPSGTSLKTAELIMNAGFQPPKATGQEEEKVEGSRGGNYCGVHIHSVRLPGYIAHQEVIFGGSGQTLTIRHDTTSRESFIPGVLMAVKEIMKIKGFVYGLEHLLKL